MWVQLTLETAGVGDKGALEMFVKLIRKEIV